MNFFPKRVFSELIKRDPNGGANFEPARKETQNTKAISHTNFYNLQQTD